MTKESTQNIKYIKIFLMVVFVAAFISLIYRGIVLYKNSNFTYDTFNLLILEEDAYLAHIDRREKQMLILKFPHFAKMLKAHNRLFQSVIIGVPVDGTITARKDLGFKVDKSFMGHSAAFKLMFNSQAYAYDGVNDLDVLKVFLATQQINDQDISEVLGNPTGNSLFGMIDKEIFNEKKSVQIINSTDINGLGAKVSAVLTTAGYNVVSVKSETSEKSSISIDDPDSISAKRIQDIFGLVATPGNAGSIADITVVLGRDIKKILY